MSQEFTSIRGCIENNAERVLFESVEQGIVRYSEVLELGSDSNASELSRRLVFCLCENDLGGLIGYLYLVNVNAVPLMLGAGIHGQQLQQLISAYQPGFIWLPVSRLAEFPGSRVVLTCREYCLISHSDKGYIINESLALLLTTSGSTGSPKFVRLSHQNVLSNAQSIADYLQLTPEEVPITTLPPSYTYGLSIIHSHVLVGSKVAVTKQTFFDRGFWDFLRSVKATSFGGVPYHYEILKKLRFTSMELPSLRTLTQAGGRMGPESTYEYALHCSLHGMRFFTMYGQAEATARMSYLPAERVMDKAGSIGVAVPGGEFWLEDESGNVQEGADAVGELIYKGPNVSMGYAYGYEDLSKGDERQGVLRTGDVARRDADGDYYIVGRLKRFLKLFGHRVNLQDIEQYLLDAGHVVACAGRDDRLEVYLPHGNAESAKAIKTLLVPHLKVSPGAVAVIVIGDLPRNESGKIRYSELTPPSGAIQV